MLAEPNGEPHRHSSDPAGSLWKSAPTSQPLVVKEQRVTKGRFLNVVRALAKDLNSFNFNS